MRDFESSDRGKRVYNAMGDEVGTIDDIEGKEAHVKPASDLSRSTRQKLGWTEEGETTYRLETSKVDKIDDKGVHLKD